MTISQAASLFNASAVVVVLLISSWVARRHVRPFFSQWVFATAVGVALMGVEAFANGRHHPLPLAVLEFAMMSTTAWFHFQCGNFLRGTPRGWPSYLLGLGLLVGLGTGLLLAGQPFPLALTPSLFAFSGSLIYTGYVVANQATSLRPHGMLQLGVAISLLGVWPLTYPAMQAYQLDWIGFWVSGLLHMLVGASMIVYVLEDVASQLRAQNARLLELDQLKGNFISTVSHELRTPLTSIVGYLELLEDEIAGPLAPTQRQYVENMRQSASHLSGLVDSILDSARLARGALEVRCEDIDLGIIAQGAVETLRAVAERKQLQLTSVVADDLPLALGDSVRLTQVLHNLIGNAIKFTRSGGAIQVHVFASPGGVRLEVRDTGIGIPTEQIERVFEPFFQVDGTLTREHNGTGLGLTIVRDMVQAMGGEVGVTSEPGNGSVFWVTLAARGQGRATVAAGGRGPSGPAR